MIEHFSKNTIGRDFVVGDIHGCFPLLEQELNKVSFDRSVDRVFAVGDLVDRGQHSEDSLIWLKQDFFHSIRGNHEQMAIDVYVGNWSSYNYICNGGMWFINQSDSGREALVSAFTILPYAIDIETDNGLVGLIHATCPVTDWNKLEEALFLKDNRNIALWDRERFENKIEDIIANVHIVYVGHTIVKAPVNLANVMYIDTGAVFSNKLTLIQL